MRKLRFLLLPVAGFVVVMSLWVFTSLTAPRVHPAAKAVPIVARPEAPPNFTEAARKAHQLALAHLLERNLPGLSVAAGVDGELVWAEGLGFADLWTSTAVTPEHRFRIGTASPALAAAGAGLLVDEGKLRLDQQIQDYVPDFPSKPSTVTLRQTMNQTSGVAEPDQLFRNRCSQTAEALQYFSGAPLQFEPGTQFHPGASGWILASAAIESAGGRPFHEFMKERVFDPLGMRHTERSEPTLDEDDPPPAILFRELIYDPLTRHAAPGTFEPPARAIVTPYTPKFRKDPNYGLHLIRPVNYSCYAGASDFASTPSDLVRFGLSMLGGKLLKPATMETLITSQRLASGENTGYGLGWQLFNVPFAGRTVRAVGHNGDSLGGMVATLLVLPDDGIVVAVTSNISYSNTFALAEKVADAFATHSAGAGR